MARGKKTSPEVIYQVMTAWAITQNLRETSRNLNLPLATVKDIVDKHKDLDEFRQLRTQKTEEFAEKASEIINKGLILLERRMNRAIEEENNLDLLIDEIFETDREELSQDEKNKLIAKIRGLQLQDIKAITTAIGTLYDKRALSRGETTQNIDFATNLNVDKLAEIAGYSKKE